MRFTQVGFLARSKSKVDGVDNFALKQETGSFTIETPH